ncbi:hypothetical protein AAGC94_16510 [Clostridium sporogenes]|uniref:hypothetical protein n=1 Tax=Clostridium TaxID=1485 RepID=UPI0005EEC02E|nr:hypothetical protein [Clostridium sporogenes]MDU1322136.1 hypothetical protein [Clostridium botulinum]KOY64120.1 hypothetical protein AN649_20375 [Clostridium sporogenes]MCW6062042.1 hypothetical protein [Clostridium sporogenes]MCW6068564.1 hypothetical protein [Clostridium sporogenes]MCW6084200.1 hypothetical protein [Clostridium sporogenes]
MNLYTIIEVIEQEFKRELSKEDGEKVITLVPHLAEFNEYPEVKVELIKKGKSDIYDLYYIFRDDRQKVESIQDKENAYIMMYYLAKNKLESTSYDSNVQRQIIGAESLEDIKRIFQKNLLYKAYSFFGSNKQGINLEKSADGYNVFYYDKNEIKTNIVENRKLNNACLVLYNYSVRMSKFYTSLEKLGIDRDSQLAKMAKDIYI